MPKLGACAGPGGDRPKTADDRLLHDTALAARKIRHCGGAVPPRARLRFPPAAASGRAALRDAGLGHQQRGLAPYRRGGAGAAWSGGRVVPLTVLSVGYALAPVGPAAVGGAEQILSALDQALVAAGHRSLVVAPEGSHTA